MRRVFRILAVLVLALGAAAVASAQAAPTPQSQEERLRQIEQLLADTRAELAKIKGSSTGDTTAAQLDELSRRIDILAREIQNMKMGEAAPALEAGAQSGERSVERFGIGPAAAKIYGIKKGVSIGGYGEVLYDNFASKDQSGNPTSGDDVITLLRAVLYLGYKFDDHFVLNTEIEYENAVVASDKGGEAEVEFAYIDYMHSAAFNASRRD
jgi:TolA-binding protein